MIGSRTSVVVTAGILLMSCSRGTLNDGTGTPGTGGVNTGMGTGNAGDTGGQGAAGSGGAVADGGVALPSCVADLIAACAPQGTCVAAIADGGTSNFCFASGVRAAIGQVADTRGCNGSRTVVSVSKPDGTLCYSYESYVHATGCEAVFMTWKDAAGNEVASGNIGGGSAGSGVEINISCSAGTATTSCRNPTANPTHCCLLTKLGTPKCTRGVPASDCAAGTCP